MRAFMCISCYQTDARAENLLGFNWVEITQQFSIYKTCFGKRMPSSVVEARYNLNSLQLKKQLQFEYANYNDLMKAKCDRRTMRTDKETA